MSEGLTGPVLVVGAGLLGTSIGLALRRHDVEVWLADVNQENVRTASGLGAGVAAPATSPGPDRSSSSWRSRPRCWAQEIGAALARFPDAVVTDVGSVKGEPLAAVAESAGARAVRRVAPDGGLGTLRPAGRVGLALRRPPVSDAAQMPDCTHRPLHRRRVHCLRATCRCALARSMRKRGIHTDLHLAKKRCARPRTRVRRAPSPSPCRHPSVLGRLGFGPRLACSARLALRMLRNLSKSIGF